MTNITFCWFCFILGGYCRCHPEVPQAPTPLWNPPGYSYATMATVSTTSASTSMVGVPTVADPPPGYPALPLPMDTTLPPKATNLLASVGVGRGKALQTMLATVRPPGPHQVRPQSDIQQQATSAGQEVTQATPYKQQVLPPQVPRPAAGARPRTAAAITQASTTTSTASGIKAGARGTARERSSPEDLGISLLMEGDLGPPPEDPGNGGEVSSVETRWTTSTIMCPLGGRWTYCTLWAVTMPTK